MSKIYHVLKTLQEPLKRRIFVTHFCQAFKYFFYYLPVPQQIKFIWKEPQQVNSTTCQLSISSKAFLSQDSRTLNFVRSFSNRSGKTKLSKNNAFIKTPSDKYHLFTGGPKKKIKHNEEMLLLKFKRNSPDATSKLNKSDSRQKLIDILYSDKSKININKIKQSGRNVYEALLDKFSLHNANSFEKNPKKINNIRSPLKKTKPRQEVGSQILSRREVNSLEASKENENSSQNISKALVVYQENQEGPENERNKTPVENSNNKIIFNSKFQANERDDRSQRKRHREKTNSFVMTKENNIINYSKAKLFKKHEPKLDYHLRKLAEKYSKAGMVKAFRHLQNEYGKGAMKTPLKEDKSKEIGIKQKILKHEHKKKMALNITKQTPQTNAYITVKPKVSLSSIPNTTVVTLNSSPNQSKKLPKLDCTVLTLDLKATADVNASNQNLPSIVLQPQMNASPIKSEQIANQDKDFKTVTSMNSVKNNTGNNLTKTKVDNETLLKTEKTTLVLTITGRKENESKPLEIQEKFGHVNNLRHSSTADVDCKINVLTENMDILKLDKDKTIAFCKIGKPDSVSETQKEKPILNEIEQSYTGRDCNKEHILHSLVVNQCSSQVDCGKDQIKEIKYPRQSNPPMANSKTEVKLTNNDSKSEEKFNSIETLQPGSSGEPLVLSESKASQNTIIKLPDKVKTNSSTPEQLVGSQDATARHIATSVSNTCLPIVMNHVGELKSCLSTKSGGDAEKVCDSATSCVVPSRSTSEVKASLSSTSKQVDELKAYNFRANAAGDAQNVDIPIAVYVGTPENKVSLYTMKKQVDEHKPCSFSAKTSGDPKNIGDTVPEHISRQRNNFEAMTSTPAVMRQFVTNPSEKSTIGYSLAKSLPKLHSPSNESTLKVANSCLVETCTDALKHKIQDIKNKSHKSILKVQSPKQSRNNLNVQTHSDSSTLIKPKHLNIDTNIKQKEMCVTNKTLLSNENNMRPKFEKPSSRDQSNQKIQVPTRTPGEKKNTLGKSGLQIKSPVEKIMSQSSLPLKEQPNSFMNQFHCADKKTIMNKEGNSINLTQNKESLTNIFTPNKSEGNKKDFKPRSINAEERGNVRSSMYNKSSDSGHVKNTYTQKGQDKNNNPGQRKKSLLLTMGQNKTYNSNETKTVNLGSGDNFNLYKRASQTNIITPSSDYKRDNKLIKKLTPYLDLKCIKTQNVFKDLWTKNINWPLNHRTVLLPKSNGLILFSSMEVLSRDEQHLKDCLKEIKDINVQDIIYINPEFILNELPSEIYNKANIFTKYKNGHIIVLVVTSSCINESLFKNISKEINGFGETSQSFSFKGCEYLKKYNKQDKLNLLHCSNILYGQENIFLMHGLNKVSFHKVLNPNVSASGMSKANLETQRKVEFEKCQEQTLQNISGSVKTVPSKESETHNEYVVEKPTNIQNCGNEAKQKPSDVSFLEAENGSLPVRYKPKSSDEKVPKVPSIINSKHMSSYTKCTDIPVESNESLNDTRIIQLFETTFKDNENQTQNKSPRIEKQKYTINFRDLIKFVKSGRENIRSINSYRNSSSSLNDFAEKSRENKEKQEKRTQESMPHQNCTEIRKICFGNYDTLNNGKNFPLESKTIVGDNIKAVSQNDSFRTGMVENNSVPPKESFGSGKEKYIALSNDKLEQMNNNCSNNTAQNQMFNFSECQILKIHNSKNNKKDIIQLNRAYKRHDSTEKEGKYLNRKNIPKSPKLKSYKKSNITVINEEDPVRKYVKKFKHKTLDKQKVYTETPAPDKNTKNINIKAPGKMKSFVNDGQSGKDNSNKTLKSGVWQTKHPKQVTTLFGYSSEASKPVNKDNENINGQIIDSKKYLSDDKIKQLPVKIDNKNDVISKPIIVQSSKKHYTNGEQRVRENGTLMNECDSSVSMNKDYEVGINAHNLQVNASSKEEGDDTSFQVNIQYVVNKSRKPESKLSESCQNKKSQHQVIEVLKPPELKAYNQIRDKKTGDFKELIDYIKDHRRISSIQNIFKDKKSGSFEELTNIIKKTDLKNIYENPEIIPQSSKINGHNSLPKSADAASMVCNTKRVINEKKHELEETLRREINDNVFKDDGKQRLEFKEQSTNLMLFVDAGKQQKSEIDKKTILTKQEYEKDNFSKIKEVGIENENRERNTDLCVKSNDTLTNNIQNVANILLKKHCLIEECSNPKPFESTDSVNKKVEDKNKTNLNDGVLKIESAISKKTAPLRIIFENSSTVKNKQTDDKISVLEQNNNTKEFQKTINAFESILASQNSTISQEFTSSEIKLPAAVNRGKETDSENPIIRETLSGIIPKVKSKIHSSELTLSNKNQRVKNEDTSNLKILEKALEGKQINKSHSDSLLTLNVDAKQSFKEFVLKNKENHLKTNEEISEVCKDKPSTKFPFREDSDNKALTEKIKEINNKEQKNIISKIIPEFAAQNSSNQIAGEKEQISKNSIPVIGNVRIKLNILDETRKDSPSSDDVELQIDLQNNFKVDQVPSPSRFIKERKDNTKEVVEQSHFYDHPDNSKKLDVKERNNELLCQKGEIKETSKQLGSSMSISEKTVSDNFKQSMLVDSNYKRQQNLNVIATESGVIPSQDYIANKRGSAINNEKVKKLFLNSTVVSNIAGKINEHSEGVQRNKQNVLESKSFKEETMRRTLKTGANQNYQKWNILSTPQRLKSRFKMIHLVTKQIKSDGVTLRDNKSNLRAFKRSETSKFNHKNDHIPEKNISKRLDGIGNSLQNQYEMNAKYYIEGVSLPRTAPPSISGKEGFISQSLRSESISAPSSVLFNGSTQRDKKKEVTPEAIKFRISKYRHYKKEEKDKRMKYTDNATQRVTKKTINSHLLTSPNLQKSGNHIAVTQQSKHSLLSDGKSHGRVPDFSVNTSTTSGTKICFERNEPAKKKKLPVSNFACTTPSIAVHKTKMKKNNTNKKDSQHFQGMLEEYNDHNNGMQNNQLSDNRGNVIALKVFDSPSELIIMPEVRGSSLGNKEKSKHEPTKNRKHAFSEQRINSASLVFEQSKPKELLPLIRTEKSIKVFKDPEMQQNNECTHCPTGPLNLVRNELSDFSITPNYEEDKSNKIENIKIPSKKEELTSLMGNVVTNVKNKLQGIPTSMSKLMAQTQTQKNWFDISDVVKNKLLEDFTLTNFQKKFKNLQKEMLQSDKTNTPYFVLGKFNESCDVPNNKEGKMIGNNNKSNNQSEISKCNPQDTSGVQEKSNFETTKGLGKKKKIINKKKKFKEKNKMVEMLKFEINKNNIGHKRKTSPHLAYSDLLNNLYVKYVNSQTKEIGFSEKVT